MMLNEVMHALGMPVATAAPAIPINHIVTNSAQTGLADLFVAIPGFQVDGHDFIPEAISRGARAIIGQRPAPTDCPVFYAQVPDARLAASQLAAARYGYPHRGHIMTGITGTNGKTTTAYMLRHILASTGNTCTLLGTVERFMNGRRSPSQMTTPDAVTLQRWLQESRDKHVVMEVSSHGLTQSRVDTIAFDYALFTNLSHEHLDYHKTAEAYFAAKSRLFQLMKPGGEAIVSTFDAYGRRLASQLREKKQCVYTYGPHSDDTLRLTYMDDQPQPAFQVREGHSIHTFVLPLPGKHHVMNAMAAILTARRQDIPMASAAMALAEFPGVPGRHEIIMHPNGARFIIDYAHTPDGLEHCLKSVLSYAPRRLMHAFGFRGGRDESKWGAMLEISQAYSHHTILTLDDLNGVSPAQMEARYRPYTSDADVTIQLDRTEALKKLWEQAHPGDCILITGKGPEVYKQEFRLRTRTDRETLELLSSQTLALETAAYTYTSEAAPQ